MSGHTGLDLGGLRQPLAAGALLLAHARRVAGAHGGAGRAPEARAQARCILVDVYILFYVVYK